MKVISCRYMAIQGRYKDAKTWDMVLVKLDHLRDPGPIAKMCEHC